jgi:hypothetical protein
MIKVHRIFKVTTVTLVAALGFVMMAWAQGQIELRLFQAVQRDGKETMDAAGILLVGNNVTKLEGNGLLTGIQVLDTNKKLPSDQKAEVGGTTCCVTTCAGTLVCGVCVCTDCKRCGPGWCDCAAP